LIKKIEPKDNATVYWNLLFQCLLIATHRSSTGAQKL